MNPQQRRSVLPLVLTGVLSALVPAGWWPAAAQSPPSRGYVTASRAALRAQSALSAPVVDYLTTNAEVEVLERTGEWCRVRAQAGAGSGFVACRLLGAAPLTRAAIEARLRQPRLSDRELLDWRSRAFWAAPSLRRLEAVGYAMERALIPPEAHRKEMDSEEPQRPRNLEFEAMKNRLGNGVAVASPVSSLRDDQNQPDLPTMMKRAALPGIRPSFFPAGEAPFAVALVPFTLQGSGEVAAGLADALSAAHGVPFRMRVVTPVRMAYFGAIGVWDIDEVSATFSHDVMVHGISARGAPTGLAITSLVAPLGQQPCTGSEIAMKARPLNGRWRSAVVAWVGKPPPPSSAAVTTRQIDGPGKWDKLVIETVDLDRDGVADFSIWAGVEPPAMDVEVYWKAVFGNVGGKWVLLAFNQTRECT